MTIKEQLLQELNSTPDRLIVETLNFPQFIKAKEQSKKELTNLALRSSSFDFLAQEPELYSLEDGASIDNL